MHAIKSYALYYNKFANDCDMIMLISLYHDKFVISLLLSY